MVYTVQGCLGVRMLFDLLYLLVLSGWTPHAGEALHDYNAFIVKFNAQHDVRKRGITKLNC